jgi:hypothetical protein
VVSNLGTQLTNTALTLAASTLSPGPYYVTDIYNNQEMGTVTINENGGFENWQLGSTGLASQTTRILLISTANPVSIFNASRAELSFQLFPNPTEDNVNIHWAGEPFQDGNVTVISANGVLVYQGKINSGALTIPTSNWPQGVYFVQMSVDGALGVRRLVIL